MFFSKSVLCNRQSHNDLAFETGSPAKMIEQINHLLFTVRVASFAKFREMQKMFLRKNFREKWLQIFAKIIIADFDPFWAQFGTIKSWNWGFTLIDLLYIIIKIDIQIGNEMIDTYHFWLGTWNYNIHNVSEILIWTFCT